MNPGYSEDEALIYLNGFMRAISDLNSYCNERLEASANKYETKGKTDIKVFCSIYISRTN